MATRRTGALSAGLSQKSCFGLTGNSRTLAEIPDSFPDFARQNSLRGTSSFHENSRIPEVICDQTGLL